MAIVFTADLLFCLSICFVTVAIVLLARFAGAASLNSTDRPLGYNASVFPVYMYDPMHRDVFDQSGSVWGVLQMFLVLLLWGATCAVYFVPVDVGVGLIAVVVVSLQAVLSYFSTRTVVELGRALRCVDELILKTAAMKADEKYQARRAKFVVALPPDVETTEKKLAEKHNALQLYSNLDDNNGNEKAPKAGEEALEQVAMALSASAIEKKHLDTMELQTAAYYANQIVSLQNNFCLLYTSPSPRDRG